MTVDQDSASSGLMNFDALWQGLFADVIDENEFFEKKPLLAHYSSLDVLTSVIEKEEIWFSNPLQMNDLEELRFGIQNGRSQIELHAGLKTALGSQSRIDIFMRHLESFFKDFDENHAFDVYVFCLSEHHPDDNDGKLSMWRGYGQGGDGAAFVIDTGKIEPLDDSAMMFAQVHYGTEEQRIEWIRSRIQTAADWLTINSVPDDQLHAVCYYLFERLKIGSLFAKHIGFLEEKEWRVVYLRQRDTNDALKHMLGYHSSPRGLEPKLKFKVSPVAGVTSPMLCLDSILHSIIIGPNASSPMTLKTMERLLDLNGKGHWKDRLFASSIPFRP